MSRVASHVVIRTPSSCCWVARETAIIVAEVLDSADIKLTGTGGRSDTHDTQLFGNENCSLLTDDDSGGICIL